MSRESTEMEARLVQDLLEEFGADEYQHDWPTVAAKLVRSLRDAPHSVIDQARGTRLASGDALVFWNAMIDAISPPEGI